MKKTLLPLLICLLLGAAPAFAQDYGTGAVLNVPYVAPGTLTLDGNADETAWADAPEIDMTTNWDGAWSGHPDPDITATAKLLYTEDTLFVYVNWEDYAFYFNGGAGDHILIGIDAVHEAGVSDQEVDENYAGWPQNAPDLGPTTYKITHPDSGGVTLNFGGYDMVEGDDTTFVEVSPVDSGWVAGTVFADDASLTWGVELAIYAGDIAEGGQIGFNIGGGAAEEEGMDERGEATYAFFSWQSVGGPGGDVMRLASSFATLNMVGTVAVEEVPLGEVPDRFELDQNFPNPFNPATTIEYALKQAGQVSLSVYNSLGQRVASLAEGPRAAGTYQVRWDAVNLPSGVYLYQLAVDGAVVASRTMTLLK